MQMFVLDKDPSRSARFLTDAHVRVICREVTMLLSTWYWYNVPESRQYLPYLPMNQNQPLALQMSSYPVRRWAVKNAKAVFDEFQYRFSKVHASKQKYDQLLVAIEKCDPKIRIGNTAMTFTFVPKGNGVHPGKTLDEAIILYRGYYRQKVANFKVPVKFTSRQEPSWLKQF